MEEKIANSLIKAKKTLSVAESCTGGLLTNRLTNVSGSSKFLRLGIIAYSNEVKARLLKIPKSIISNYGAVSAQTATLMAQKVRKLSNTDYGIGISGIAGPSGATKTKPIGLVYIAVTNGIETLCLECHFNGSRLSIKSQAATQALKLLNEFLI